MDGWLDALVAVFIGISASSGFWAYFQSKGTTKNAQTQLLLGLAHDRIIYLGMRYIEQGWISKDEYEDYFHYLGDPYSTFGGNGIAEKVMNDVKKLPMYNRSSQVMDLTILGEDDGPPSPRNG